MGTYELSILRLPNGRFTFVGRVPFELCETRYSAHYGQDMVAPLIYDTYNDALIAKRDFEAKQPN